MPPLVPATVRAKVPLLVMGEPLTEIKPPVKLCATLVSVPVVVSVAHAGAPAVTVSTWPAEPMANFASVLDALA